MSGHRKENKTPYKIRGTRPWQKRAHLEQLGVLIDEMAEWTQADLEAEQARLKRKLAHEEGILKAMAGVLGLTGWQWLFLLEALPSLVLGAVVIAYLTTASPAPGG